MVFNLLSWLTSKKVFDTFLQFLLLVATGIGAAATVYIAWLAGPNLRALRRYVKATVKMEREQLRQGRASRRPFFNVNNGNPSDFHGTPVFLHNVGGGIAYKVSWEWTTPDFNRTFPGYELGAISPGMIVPVYLKRRTKQVYSGLLIKNPICIRYQDAAGLRYWSEIQRTEQGYYVIDTGGASR